MAERETMSLGPLPRQSSWERLRSLLPLWAGFGVVTGLLTAPPGGPLGLVSGVLAGLIVLCPLGAFLALIGGQVKPSLAGGLAGIALGGLTALLLSPTVLTYMACLGLVAGGLAGGTCSAAVGWLRFLLTADTTSGRSQ